MSKCVVDLKLPKIYKELGSEKYRYHILYGGRSAGRSWTIARKLLLRGATKKTRILCAREFQASIRKSSMQLLKDQIELMGLGYFYKITDKEIRGKNGTLFTFSGIKLNNSEIKGTEGVNICWIEEAHNLSAESWDIIDPTIRAAGSMIWISFNTKSKYDTIYEAFVLNQPPPRSLVIKSTYLDNPYNSQTIKDQAQHCKLTDLDKYDHIWSGNLQRHVDGSIFRVQFKQARDEQRFLSIPIEKNREVHTFWDLGRNDSTTIIFVQRDGRYFNIIDAYSNRLEEVEHYVRHVKSLDYLYGTHYLPHDGEHERLGMHASIIDQFRSAGISPITPVSRIPVKMQAIELARVMFPKVRFHVNDDPRGTRMDRFIEALTVYQFKQIEDMQIYSDQPLKNWATHYADAFLCLAQSEKNIGGKFESIYSDWKVSINE